MTKLAIFCTLIALSSGHGFAQEVSAMFNMGAGTFRMKTQREFQNEFRGSVIPWRPVHKFPPYWISGGSVSWHVSPSVGVVLSLELGSTGGTLHYADYSGSARMDQLLKYTQWGIGSFVQINQSEIWPLFATAHLSISRTKQSVSYVITVADVVEKDREDFRSTNLGLRPGLMLQRRLNSFLFQANLGLEMQFPGRLETEDGSPFVGVNGDSVSAQWSGLRGSLGVGLMLVKKKEKQ